MECEQVVHVLAPILEREVSPALYTLFGTGKENVNEPVQRVNLIILQIVLGNDDVTFTNNVPLPGCESHIRFLGVGSGHDKLCGCLMGNGIEQLVLGFGEEHLCRFVCLVIIAAEGKKIAHLLIEPFF